MFYWSFVYERPISFKHLKLKLVQIGRKAPPPFCLLVRYSAHVMAHDVTSHTDISLIIEPHIGYDLAEKPPTPQSEGKFFDTRSIHFRQFQATLVFVAEKSPSRKCLCMRITTRYERLLAGCGTHFIYLFDECFYLNQ